MNSKQSQSFTQCPDNLVGPDHERMVVRICPHLGG